jgi:hypothetical protein
MTEQKTSGSCLCGGVAFEVSGPMRPVVNCHCNQCRKQTGHYLAATNCPTAKFNFTSDKGLKWYRASETARRGFCENCGSTLFWQADGNQDEISIAAGALDGTNELSTAGHIFVAWKGDYYDIPDYEPQFPESGQK